MTDKTTVDVAVADLSGAALDWAVAKARGEEINEKLLLSVKHVLVRNFLGELNPEHRQGYTPYRPSQHWHQGGPILEHEGISIAPDKALRWERWSAFQPYMEVIKTGETALEAGMRCYVAMVTGDTIHIPAVLVEGE